MTTEMEPWQKKLLERVERGERISFAPHYGAAGFERDVQAVMAASVLGADVRFVFSSKERAERVFAEAKRRLGQGDDGSERSDHGAE